MDSDGSSVKECLSKREVNSVPEWSVHAGDNKQVDCLKISVVPEGGEWDEHGKNYCFHDVSNNVRTLQTINFAGWMVAEWGATALIATYGTPVCRVSIPRFSHSLLSYA